MTSSTGGPASAATGPIVRRRATWTLGDQVVNSLQSLGIGLVVVRSTDLVGAGAFAVAFITYQVVMAVTRPLHSDALVVGFSSDAEDGRRSAAAMSAGAALVLGFGSAIVIGTVGASLGGPVGSVLLAFAAGVPALCLQDVWRGYFFAEGTPSRAFANDLLVLVALLFGILCSGRAEPHSAAALTLAWSGAAWAGAIAGIAQARIGPLPRRALAWWRTTFHLASRMLGENVLANLAYAVALLSVGAWAGVEPLGQIRTAQVALSPVSPMIIAMTTVVVAEGVRALSRSPARFPHLIVIAAVASSVTALSLTAVGQLLPVHLGTTLIGHNWALSRKFLLPWGGYVAASGVTLASAAGLRALRRPGSALRCRAWASGVGLGGSLLGMWLRGPVWALFGFGCGELLCAWLTARSYRATWRRWRAEPWDIGPLALIGGMAAM